MNILEKQLIVKNRKGVHGRIATRMIKIAHKHKVKMCIICDGQITDCSSVLDILSIALAHGTTFTLRVAGQDRDKAMSAAEKLMNDTDEP